MKLRMIASLVAGALFTAAALFASPQARRQEPVASISQASTAIIGSVVDATLTPIGGVRVMLERDGQPARSETTTAAGTFRFERVVAGTYRLHASHTGYADLVRDVRVPAGAASIRLPIVLEQPSERLGGRGQSNMQMDGISALPPAGRSGGVMPPMPPPSESVNVTAQAPLIQAQSGERSAAATAAQVENLPISHGKFTSVTAMAPGTVAEPGWHQPKPTDERYAHVEAGAFHRSMDDPLSTFGADVDTASFANVRRFLQSGRRPPVDAVRVEEFINYFRYAYPTPRTGHPIGLTTEVGDCPWAQGHKLVLIGARAIPSSTREVEGRNIVLLIDVSGSMSSQDKLPLLKSAFNMFVDALRPDDRIAIVTYAGYSGLALPSTPARDRQTIHAAIDRLGAGGSTNGGQGIIQAYRVARGAFIPGGVNRVILATDGDFNVGIVGQTDLLALIRREKESGIFLSVFGVGTDNIKDDTMEMLADKGNGQRVRCVRWPPRLAG